MSAVHAARRARYLGTAGKPAEQPAQQRGNGLAQIHIAAAQLGLNDGCSKPKFNPAEAATGPACSCAYHCMLWGVARARSAAALDHAGRARVLAHLKACGFRSSSPKKPTPGRPHNMNHATRGPMLGKIEALLLDAGRPWAYVHEMAAHMFKVDDVAFCHEGQLHDLVAALEVDKRRRGARPRP